MFLFERLIGVSIYAFFLFLFCFAIKYIKGMNIHLNIYCIVLATMGFFYAPLSGSDLGRVQQAMQAYASLSWNKFVDTITDSSSPLAVFYYYVVGNLGDDRLLPCISAIITYSLCFGIIKSVYKNKFVKKDIIVMALFFFMARGLLIATIANIRTMLSLAIIGFAIYKIILEKKSFTKYAAVIVIGSLIHVLGMLAAILFFGFYIFAEKGNTSRVFKCVQILIIAILTVLYGKSCLMMATEKGNAYLQSSINSTGYFYIWELVLSLIVLFVNICCVIIFFRNKKINYDVSIDRAVSIFVIFIAYLTIIDLGLIFIEFNSGYRLSWLISILDIPFILTVFTCELLSKKPKRQLMYLVLFCSIVMLIIACSRGDLCSLKFF